MATTFSSRAPSGSGRVRRSVVFAVPSSPHVGSARLDDRRQAIARARGLRQHTREDPRFFIAPGPIHVERPIPTHELITNPLGPELPLERRELFQVFHGPLEVPASLVRGVAV